MTRFIFALAAVLLALARPVIAITKVSHLLKLQHQSLANDCIGFECVQRYVDQPDRNYGWSHVAELGGRSSNGVSWRGHVLKMTSQQWLGKGETSAQFWEHPLTLIFPSASKPAASDWATFLIGGADTLKEDTDLQSMESNEEVQQAIHIATHTGSTVAVLGNIPHQSMSFREDPHHVAMQEDEIKAFTWRQFMDHPDHPEWPIEAPILKAVVRGMDTVSAFSNATEQRFIATGCSKRGIAAAMVAALDERVQAYAPCSIGINTYEVLKEQSRAYGGDHVGSVALHSYVENGVMDLLDTPRFRLLMGENDPFSYIERLAKPVLWMTAGRDDFFMPDHTKSWWKQLPTSQKHHVVDGNSAHAGKMTPKFLGAVETFVSSIIADVPTPGLSWSIDNRTGAISATVTSSEVKPRAVRLWQAMTCGSDGRRDFRLKTLDPPERCMACGISVSNTCIKSTGGNYESQPLERAPGAAAWVASVEVPAKDQFTAFFIEFEFSGPTAEAEPWQLATEVSVVPLTYPFPECHGKGCAVTTEV
eukprot:gb/GFBE01073096.1/.p1 GENE.gb/GFBE01073096.1/~~gb/GFBE01073096.1/.p1  ORF type:complete len:533 (+),score=87.84 gb/GFBE01073096.1/:1-1599(+)